MSLRDDALQMHKENQGKLKTTPYVKVTNIEELSLAYSIEAVEVKVKNQGSSAKVVGTRRPYFSKSN